VSDVDHIRNAVAIARASRWLGATAVAMAAALLASLFMGRPLHTLAALALCVAILAGAAMIYLMVRVELDRSIFEAALDAADANAYFIAFDQSRSQLGLGRPLRQTRPVADRVRGLIRLVRTMGCLLAVQVILVLAGVWVGRWPF
jgi:hypothetical protein